MTMDHAHVSELLGPLVAGGLDAARRSDVERHLHTCEDCSQELLALQVLTALEAPELTPGERAALRSGIAASARPRPSWARFMPALAAAAVIAIAVVGFSTLDMGGGQDAGGAAISEEADTGAEDRSAGRDADSDVASDSIEDTAQATIESGGAGGDAGQAADTFEAAVPGTAKAGNLAFDERRAPTPFATIVLDPGLLDARARDLRVVANSVPSAWREQLDTCTRRLFTSPPAALTLAFAGAFPRDDLLIAGFTWSEASSRRPTHYAFWGWWRGDCDSVSPVFVQGTL